MKTYCLFRGVTFLHATAAHHFAHVVARVERGAAAADRCYVYVIEYISMSLCLYIHIIYQSIHLSIIKYMCI